MKTVLLMRHAKSSWEQAALTDHERPLNPRGLRDVPRMASWLDRQSVEVEWCLASTAVRATETAKRLQQFSTHGFPLEFTQRLYHAEPEQILKTLRELPEELQSCLIVAHNPGLEELVWHWSRKERPVPTAALAAFAFPETERWADLHLNSRNEELFFQIPKALPKNTA